MPNRRKAPKINMSMSLELPDIQVHHLDNGIPVHVVAMGTQEVLKLEAIFHAGRPFEHKKLASRGVSSMLKEGNSRLNSAQLAEELDFYGSSLSAPFNIDTGNLVLYSLKKHFDQVLPHFADTLKTPSFPKDELEAFIQRNQQHLQIDLRKNEVLSYRKITELIFGENHPYGYNSFPETYGALRRDDLVEHHERLYTQDNCQLILSGKVDDHVLQQVNRYLGKEWRKNGLITPILEVETSKPRAVFEVMPESLQASIRIGNRLFNRQHQDSHGLSVLNTLLGGYFGSRLMANIREDKGYTYNISSVVDFMQFDGCFYISTEVGNEFVQSALQEIYREMELLQTELVDEEELLMVQNYLMGNFLAALDGPFNVSEVVKIIVSEELPLSFFREGVQNVRDITAEEIQRLAQIYLQRDNMWEVIVGAEALSEVKI